MFHPCAKSFAASVTLRFHVGEAAVEGRALAAFAARVELSVLPGGPW